MNRELHDAIYDLLVHEARCDETVYYLNGSYADGSEPPGECPWCRLAVLLNATPIDEIQTAPARTTDPKTSKEAKRRLTGTTAYGKLAIAFYKARVLYGWDGLTSDAAVRLAGLESLSCPWKRVSDLKAAGIIAPTGEVAPARSGADQQVLSMTDFGVAEVRRVMVAELAAL